MNSITFKEKYNAFVRKDSSFEGLFVMAVKTTGIFCRPHCTARKPKPENVEFFTSNKEALQNGYRPCKICKPLEPAGNTPRYIRLILDVLRKNPYLKLKDQDLREQGVEPTQIRRWFQKHHGMTFHAYQRLLRINQAYRQISNGDSVTSSVFDSGYESLSGFSDQYTSIFGSAPTQSADKTVINIVRFTTPLGPMFGCATSKGICLAEFTDRRMLETNFQTLRKRLKAVILPGGHPYLDDLQQQLTEYFDGSRTTFDLPLDTPGTPFQQSVWKILHTIPYGETRSYQEEAEMLKHPSAVRAVANANGQNRVTIIIPCHRVIGKDGDLTGYGGGLERKQWLLDFEQATLKSLVHPKF